MNPRPLLRAWPALAASALFALVAAAPAPGGRGPAPPAQSAAACEPFSRAGGGDSTYGFAFGSGIRQPFPAGMPIALCSLQVQATGWNSANVRLVEWDPLAMAPDANAIALRTAFCGPSQLLYYTINSLPRFEYVPPVVTHSLAGVADPPRAQVALEVTQPSSSFIYSFSGHYAPDGDPGMPAARTYGATGELQGAHPVVAHALCDGGGTLADLRVVQAVNRADTPVSEAQEEFLQRFRVPEQVEVRWVEVALNERTPFYGAPLMVGIAEAAGPGDPGPTMPTPLVESGLVTGFYWQPGPRWAAPVDFDQVVTLFPNRDYWLTLRTAQDYTIHTHARTASESPEFQYAIRDFHHRALASDPWTPDPAHALSFKIVGTSAGAPGSVPPRAGFRLTVSPNHAPGSPAVEWSGATGPVRLEVFDARGRRVSSFTGGAAGRWAVSARGGALASGVYFVRARDSEGERASERLVVVR